MERPKPKILYISSLDPLKGPGAIEMGHYQCMKDAGLEVDFLTLRPVEGHPEIMHVKSSITWFDKIQEKIKRKLRIIPHPHYNFFYKKEEDPPVSTLKVLNSIKRDYDWVIIYFCQQMLSFQTVEAIYDKLNKPIVFFFSPDFFYMSGGCHFPGECTNYQTGCGCCPVFNSKNPNDFTHRNVMYRERVYKKIRPVVFGNNYMQSFYRKSFLLKDARLELSTPKLNVELYHPIDRKSLLKKYGISSGKSFIIAFGCQGLTSERKGIKYLIEALHIWQSQMRETDREKILLIAAGRDFESIKDSLPFDSIGLGMLDVGVLPEFYSLADVFVCPSVNDAGPSMVGQSIACGTPVIGFEMGALLDHVKGKGTGYCAELRNSADLAKGLDMFFIMEKAERDYVRSRCLEWANKCGAIDRIQVWMDIFYKYYRDEKIH